MKSADKTGLKRAACKMYASAGEIEPLGGERREGSERQRTENSSDSDSNRWAAGTGPSRNICAVFCGISHGARGRGMKTAVHLHKAQVDFACVYRLGSQNV